MTGAKWSRGVTGAGVATAVIVAAALAVAGCGSFDDPSTIKDLRVLSVRAEPSEVILNVSDPADSIGVPLSDIALSPLIVDPLQRPIAVTVSLCANDPAATSPPNNGADPTNYPAGGVRTTVGSALCDGAPSQVLIARDVNLAVNPSIRAGLDPAWVGSAFASDVFIGPDGKPHGGFDLGMPIVFQVSAQAGDEVAIAIKRAIVWAHPVRDDQMPNVAPVIPGVRLFAQRDVVTAEPIPGAVLRLDEGVAIDVAPDGAWIDPVDAADPTTTATAEAYVTAALDRTTKLVTPVDAKETLTYTFYASAGTFSPFETRSEPPPGTTPPPRIHLESKYHPPAAPAEPVLVTIWIAVRDERGGASWVTRTLRIPARGSAP